MLLANELSVQLQRRLLQFGLTTINPETLGTNHRRPNLDRNSQD